MSKRESVRRALFDPRIAVALAALSPVWILMLEPFPADSDATAALRLLAVPGSLLLAAADRVAVALGLATDTPPFWAIVALAFYAVAVALAAGLRSGDLRLVDLLP